jgi:hypothetical protein
VAGAAPGARADLVGWLDFTLTATGAVYPSGTSVAVYPRAAMVQGQAPSGVSVASATSGTSSVAFTGLAYDTAYVAYALLGGVHTYKTFRTDPAPSVVVGPAGPAGVNGSSSPGTDAWDWAQTNVGPPALIADWGTVWNAMIAAGIIHVILPDHGLPYPWSTTADLHGVNSHVLFEGAQGRGWYVGSAVERRGTRMIFKGGASPTVTRTDGSMTSGSAVLTTASGPFTNGGNASNIYHVGQPITVVGAGAGGTNLVTQIVSRQSATQVTLAAAAGTSVSGASFTFTDWTRAINCLGSSGVEFRDLKITYDNPAFDGILIDMRSDSSTWSARGRLYQCVVGGETIDWAQALGNQCVKAYTLVHVGGMGEHFTAEGTTFGGGKALVRGQYENNCDDATFIDCEFAGYFEAAIVNPGRFWSFNGSCTWHASAGSGPKVGPAFKTDGPKTLPTILYLHDCELWDTGVAEDTANAAITSGSNVVTISSSYPDLANQTDNLFWKDRLITILGAGPSGAALTTRVVKRLSATTLQLRDTASTTVASAAWALSDGGFIYQEPGYSWIVVVDNLMTWLTPGPEIEMRGSGMLMHDGYWWNNRPLRSDTAKDAAPFLQFGDPATNMLTIRLADLGFTTPNTFFGSIGGIDGHNVERVERVPFALERRIRGLGHENVRLTADSNFLPTVALYTGGVPIDQFGAAGGDQCGLVGGHTTGVTTAGSKLLKITFAKPWVPDPMSVAASQGTAGIWLAPATPEVPGAWDYLKATHDADFYVSEVTYDANHNVTGFVISAKNSMPNDTKFQLAWTMRRFG